MDRVLSVIRTTLFGGVLFLLPFGLLLIVLDKLYQTFAPLGLMIHGWLAPGSGSVIGPASFAILVLTLIAFLAGTFARTGQGRHISARLEKATLGRIPLYAYLRPALDDLAGEGSTRDKAADAPIVEVRAEDVTTLGVLIEWTADDRAVVFFPDAPSAMSGSVAIVARDRVFPTAMTRAAFFMALRGFGTGMGQTQALDSRPATD